MVNALVVSSSMFILKDEISKLLRKILKIRIIYLVLGLWSSSNFTVDKTWKFVFPVILSEFKTFYTKSLFSETVLKLFGTVSDKF